VFDDVIIISYSTRNDINIFWEFANDIIFPKTQSSYSVFQVFFVQDDLVNLCVT